MTASIVPFQFESKQVRVVEIDGDPWFVAKDVATTLGFKDTVNAVKQHCRRAKSLKSIGVASHHPQENQALSELDPQTKLIPESDLYRLVLRSQLESAERFQDWVVEEVLPQIRKTGQYVPARTTGDALVEMALAYRDHERKILALEKQQADTAAQVKALVGGEGYYTVVGYANRVGVRIDEKEAARLGKTASHHCKLHGIHRGEAPHPRYGKTWTYPVEVLDIVFGAEGQDAA